MALTNLVPPNGGYGWFIACAFSLHHMIVVPLAHSFGLVFKDKFKQIGFSATDVTLIVNTNAATTFWCGLLNGALLKQFGSRKVSLFGAFFMTTGIFLTAYAETFTQYMILYGFIAAIGMGMGTSAYPFALNTYFTTKRGKAFGYAMTVSGCGAVLLPQLVSLLLSIYAEKGTVIILSGIASHAFISAVLLQPVKWHMKKEVEEEKGDEDENLLTKDKPADSNPLKGNATNSTLALADPAKIGSIYSLHSLHSGSILSLHSESRARSSSVSCRRNNIQNNMVDKGSSETVVVLNEKRGDVRLEDKTPNTLLKNENDCKSIPVKTKNKQDSLLTKVTKYVINLFDLELLKDWTFVNIIVGISLGVCSEKSFTLLIAFIMQDYGLDTQQIATFMSTLSITDICFRFVAPYVSDFFKKPVRIMYMWSVLLLIIFRCGLLLTNDFAALLVCAVLIGFARGFRIIYWMLVVPNYVPIERLASAAGLQSILNGIVIWCAGPFLGFIRDLTGSYRVCVLILNLLALLSILMWGIEYAYKGCKSRRARSGQTENLDAVISGQKEDEKFEDVEEEPAVVQNISDAERGMKISNLYLWLYFGKGIHNVHS
ncbi:hypothetical protein Trydic_g9770 [Trypoxylus dichotomus]